MAGARTDLATVFERAPGLAERIAGCAGADPDAILAAARSELAQMSEDERIAVLDSHPRIGADPASLSALSRSEQGGGADFETMRELARLNDDYEHTFGFRFVVFMRRRSKAEIIPVLRERLRRTRDEELAAGVEEFLAITRARLEKST